MPMTVTAGAETAEIRIYVACLAAYNGGRLHGTWIDAEQDADDIQTQVDAMLASSPEPMAEEWAIHDYEGFEGMTIHESHGFAEVAELAALLSEHGPAYAAYANNIGEQYAAADGFEESFNGTHASEQEFAEQLIDDVGGAESGSLAERYFDYEAFTRDLFMGDYWSDPAPGGGVFVFRNL
jgi:antirestriction protein